MSKDPQSVKISTPAKSDESKKPISTTATGVSAASARALGARLIAFYFRAPVKAFFRTRVDYLAFARAINPRVQAKEAWSWRMSSPAILAYAVRTYGWGFIPNQVLPPLLANVNAGAVLYTTYLQVLGDGYRVSQLSEDGQRSSHAVANTLMAGAAAGAVHSTIITPLEMLQRSFRTTDITEHKYKDMWRYGLYKSQELGFRRLYAGWGLCFAKDTAGCAVFFATFEFVKSRCYKGFVEHYYGPSNSLADESMNGITTVHRDVKLGKPHYAVEPAFLMLAGIAASVIQQAIQHPLERIQDSFYKVLQSTSSDKSGRQTWRYSRRETRQAYQRTVKRIQRHAQRVHGWRRCLFKGFFWNTVRQVPSTSAGLVIFELVRRRQGFDGD